MKTLKLEVIFGAVDRLSPALKLLVAGSKGFNNALRGMQRELKTLQNQAKMIDGFKRQKQAVQESARAMQQMQQKIKALHQQMRQNPNDNQIAKTYQKALQEAKKLKEAHKQNQATLQRMRNELRQAGISTNSLSDYQRRLSQSIRQTNDNIRRQEEQLKRLNQVQRQSASMSNAAHKGSAWGMNMMTKGAIGAFAISKPVNESKHVETEMARIASLGLGKQTTKDAIAYAKAMQTFGTSTLDNMELLRDGMTAFADLHHAEMVAPYLAKMKFANKAMYGTERAADNERVFMDMLKVIEMRNGLKDEKTFMRQADMIQQVVTATGGMVNATEWLNAIKTGGIAVKGLDDKALYHYMEPIVQEMGGFRYGTAAMSAYQNLYQGRTTKRAANNLLRLGLIEDEKKMEYDKAGQVTHLDVGAIKGADLFKKNQFAWMEEILLPALAEKGITERGDVLDAIGSIFTNRTAAGLFSTMYDQREQILKNAKLNAGADGIEDLYLKTKDTTAGKELEAKAKLSDAYLELGDTILPIYTQAIEYATGKLQAFTAWMERNPALAKVLGVGLLAVVTGLLAIGGVLVVFSPLLLGLASLRLVLTTLPMAWTTAAQSAGLFSRVAGGLGKGMTLAKAGILGLGKAFLTAGRFMLANPMVLAITALIAVVAVSAYLIYKHWNTIKAKATELWGGIKSVFDDGKAYLLGAWDSVKGVASGAWDSILSAVDTGITAVKNVIAGIDTVFANNPILNLLIPFIGIPRMIIANWGEISSFFSNLWSSVMIIISTAWQSILMIVSQGVQGVSNFLSTAWAAIATNTQMIWSSISAVLQSIWASISTLAMTYFDSAKNAIINAWNVVSSFTSAIWSTIRGIVAAAWSALCNVFYTVLPINGVRSAFNAVLGYLSGLSASFFAKGKNIIDGLINGVNAGFARLQSTWAKINSYMPSFMSKRMDIHSPSRLFMRYGNYIMQGLDIGITKGMPALIKVYGKVMDIFSQPAYTGGLTGGNSIFGKPKSSPFTVGVSSPITKEHIAPKQRVLTDFVPDYIKNSPVIGAKVAELTNKAQQVIDNAKNIGQKITAQIPSNQTTVAGDTITININGVGQNAQEIAKEVQRVLQQHERNKAARYRDSYQDYT